MRKHRAVALACAALMLVAPELAVSQTSSGDAFVKGATDFLLDRANDNYIYIFQKKLASNPLLEKYLPATLAVAKAGDLRALITHKDLWKDALRQDLVGDGDRLFGKVLDEWQQYTDKLCSTEAASAKKLCDELRAQIQSVRTKSPVKTGAPAASGTKDPMSGEPERTTVMLMSPGPTRALSDLARDINQVKPVACSNPTAGKYTACMIQILAILDAVSHADYVANCYFFGNMCSNGKRDKSIANREEDDDFSDFRRYALFFAQLADATGTNDRNEINALLKSVTIPPVSFGIKREPHATRVLVTAYVGGGWSRESASPHQQVWGIVAPVGVEVSQARDSGNSLSLLISPLDFGYPLTLKLKNTDATVKGSDVVVPSAYVFYGWKNYPFAAGVGYSRGRSVENPDQRVGRVLILLAFDMPLFKLH